MGRLIIETIEVENFFSYGSPPSRLSLGGRGVLALVGANGAGKSSAASKAPTWCLFGKCAPERMGSGTQALRGKDVVRRDAPKGAEARVQVVLRSGPRFVRVTRTRGRSRRSEVLVETAAYSPAASDDAYAARRASPAGPLVWEKAGDDQRAVEAAVGCDYDTWTRTVVRGQGDPWNFAEATDARKREILDVVSGADTLAPRYELAKQRRVDAERRAGEHLRAADDRRRQAAACDPDTPRAKSAAWLAARESTVEAARTRLQEAQDALDAAGRSAAAREAAEAARVAVEARRPELPGGRQQYLDAVTAARARRDAASGDATRYAQDVDRLGVTGDCPTCGQPVGPNAPVQQWRAAAEANLVAARAALAEGQAAVAAAESSRDAADAWLRDAEAAWRADLAKHHLPPVADEAVAVAARDAAQAALDATLRAEDPHAALAAAEEARRALLESEAAVFAESAALAEREANVARALERATSPKGVRAHMAEATLAAIEVSANEWLEALSGGRMTVRFPATKAVGRGSASTTKEEIQTAVTLDGAEVALLSLSGGERRRVNLAVDLGVADAVSGGSGGLPSLLVLDEEVFSGVDEAGKAAIAYAVAGSGVADVLVVDHDPRLTSAFHRVARVVRDDTGSRIEETA